MPEKKDAKAQLVPGEFLDESVTATAALGLPAASKEITQFGDEVAGFFTRGFDNIVDAPISAAFSDEQLDASKAKLRAQHHAIIGYLAELSHSTRDDEQSRQLLALVSQVDELAHLADALNSSFKRINRRRRRSGATLSRESQESVNEAKAQVFAGFMSALTSRPGATAGHDAAAARWRAGAFVVTITG